MRKQKAQVRISKENTIETAQAAKELVKTLTTGNDGDWSPVMYMESELEHIDEVTTYRRTGIGCQTEPVRRQCSLKRVTALTVMVMVPDRFTAPQIEIEFLAEGYAEGRNAMAKIKVWTKWVDNWYLWDQATENCAPDAPYATLFLTEE